MQKQQAKLREADIALYAISGQSTEQGKALAARLGLSFPLLADPDARVTRSWGLYDPGNGTAWPATYAVDRTRKIRWRHISATYPKRPTAAQLDDALAALSAP